MKIGRNDPCPCGSGKKYKKCCLNKLQPANDLLYRRVFNTFDDLMIKMLGFFRTVYGEEGLTTAVSEFLFFDEELCTQDVFDDLIPVSIPWVLFEWYSPPDVLSGDTTIEAFTSTAEIFAYEMDDKLTSLERQVLNACDDTYFSFYEVLAVNPGTGIRMKDILTGRDYYVTDKKASNHTARGDIIYASIFTVDNIQMFLGCSPIGIPPSYKPHVIDLRELLLEEAGFIDEDVLFEYEDATRWLFLRIYKDLRTPPKLLNTDGEPIVFHKLIYDIDDPEVAFRALRSLCVGETESELREMATVDESDKVMRIKFPWTRRGHKLTKQLDNTILGTIDIRGNRMVVEVNSAKRARKIKKEIKRRLRGSARYNTAEITPANSITERIKTGDLPSNPLDKDLKDSPELKEKVRELTAQLWKEWLHEKNPTLGGKTPLEAIKTPDGKESVEALILDFEREAIKRGDLFGELELECLKEVRKKLGLDRVE